MTITDLITFILSIVFMSRGASRGFMNSLINPFSIIVTTILSIVYYQTTKNLIISLLIGSVGPLLMNLLLKILLRSWAKATNTDIKPTSLSRLGGAILTLIWWWVFIVFTLLLLVVIPTSFGKTWEAVHNDVTHSISYCRIAKPLGKRLLDAAAVKDPVLSKKVSALYTAEANQDAAAVTKVYTSFDTKSLAEDPRFQKVLQDPEVQQEINAHDIVKLMGNPKMIALTQQIMSDPETMKKVMALYRSQAQAQALPAQTTPAQAESATSGSSN